MKSEATSLKRSPVLLCKDRQICLHGKVVCGKKLGRTLGFPTANQMFSKEAAVPECGIYASIVEIRSKRYCAVSNVGTRPTVDGTYINCESYIIGYSGELYGEEIDTTFVAFIREEQRFSSIEELRLAIEADVSCALEFFSEWGKAQAKKSEG